MSSSSSSSASSQSSGSSGSDGMAGAMVPAGDRPPSGNTGVYQIGPGGDDGSNQDILDQAQRYQTICAERQPIHAAKAVSYARQHLWIGIPLVICTALAGISSVGSVAQSNSVPFLNWLIIASSLIAAILAPLQTFLNFAEKSTRHQESAINYENLSNRIEVFFLRYPTAKSVVRKDAVEMMEKFTAELAQLGLKNPVD